MYNFFIIDAGTGYQNMKLDERSSCITTFACQQDMLQRTIDKIFKDLPNIFGITDDILVVGYDRDGKDHNDKLQSIL